MHKTNILISIAGPTAIGKTSLSINLAKKLNTEIISADSRQVYKEISIGTAKPTINEQNSIKHHLIDFLDLKEIYSAGNFVKDANKIINELFQKYKYVIMTGGSGLYINSFCDGIDDMPLVDMNIRNELNNEFKKNGLKYLLKELSIKDPIYYQKVDLNNPRRVIRALEICRSTEKAYSTFRQNTNYKRDFKIIKIGLNMDRKELYERINLRVDQMLESGLIEEAQKVYKYKNLNSLQTVGYKEIFDFFDKKTTLNEAIELIKRNSRRYAKRQMTWFSKDPEIKWFISDKYSLAKILDNILSYSNSI